MAYTAKSGSKRPARELEIVERLPRGNFVRAHVEAQVEGEYQLAMAELKRLGLIKGSSLSNSPVK